MSKRTVLEITETTETRMNLKLDRELSDEELEMLEEFERTEQPEDIDDYAYFLREHGIGVEVEGNVRDPDDWSLEWTDTSTEDK